MKAGGTVPFEFTTTQKRRLTELNASREDAAQVFADEKERNAVYRELEKKLMLLLSCKNFRKYKDNIILIFGEMWL